jgi:hypothetical protein
VEILRLHLVELSVTVRSDKATLEAKVRAVFETFMHGDAARSGATMSEAERAFRRYITLARKAADERGQVSVSIVSETTLPGSN